MYRWWMCGEGFQGPTIDSGVFEHFRDRAAEEIVTHAATETNPQAEPGHIHRDIRSTPPDGELHPRRHASPPGGGIFATGSHT